MNMNLSLNNNYWKYLSNLQNEIIYGGYLTAIGAPSLVLMVSIIMNVAISWPILVIAYLIPLIVYSFDYYKDLDKDMVTNSERSIYLKKKKKMYPYILGFYIALLSILLIIYTNISLVFFILLMVLGGVLYSTLLKKITKKIPIFKNIYTDLSWALCGTLFVPLYYSISINMGYLFIFLFIFLKGLVNVLFFDLKDIKSDEKEKLKTLPVMLGKNRVINLLYLINFLSVVPLLLGIYMQNISLFAVGLIIFYFYGFYYLFKAKISSNKVIRTKITTLVDFEYILWPLVLLGCKLFI